MGMIHVRADKHQYIFSINKTVACGFEICAYSNFVILCFCEYMKKNLQEFNQILLEYMKEKNVVNKT